ncbi:PREDICTED: uncharacterized protein LOC109588731 isoform X2 [Amphimedon queenslandica]|uniref:Death domain-containing protein n=1 Tax=Amphimedon queenslandica TaxID=400682 RepID=A0AAN0JTH7_AMPQE|nr:PREDICTED: uncharacterized protein LOC109588731 isoform X2 [Amphimedon queenslandica]|eukprot:XP_019860408.1 PREDICTED: uncharacterized protein LOC109588731 isoform X2 [Amphimedon queenslandica]
MAKLLHEEVISDEALSCVMSTRGSVSDSRTVLLKAVRDAVHSNYKHLELFVTVLRKFSETAHIGDTIFEEYRNCFKYYDDVEEDEIHFLERNVDLTLGKKSQRKPMSTISESLSFDQEKKHSIHKILFPRNMKNKFKKMRIKFGSTFYHVRRSFTSRENILNIYEVKELILNWFPDLKPQLCYKKTIGEVLNVVKRKCNIIDISPLEVLAFEFKIEEAEPIIKSYKEEAKDFCKSVSVSLCLGEELQAVATPSRLLCETVVFVFNWDPDEHTLQDINDVLNELEPLHKCHIQIDKVGPGRSVVVTCYCPAEYTDLLKRIVLEKIDTLQRKGLKEFVTGNCTLWDTSQVFLAQINNLTADLEDRDKRILELATFKELSESRLKEIEALQIGLKESQCINDSEKELASLKELSENRLEEIEQLKMKLESTFDDITELSGEEAPETNESLDTDTSIEEEDGEVEWSYDDVHLFNPSVNQCIEVINKLEDKHELVALSDSSSDVIQFLIPIILERSTVKTLCIFSSILTRDDILSFSTQISTNISLTSLDLSNGSISDDGVIALAQSLQYNNTLQYLDLAYNTGITSASAQPLVDLLLINSTLCRLDLYHTSIGLIGVMILMELFKTNKTLKELKLDKRYKETCSYFEQIKNRVTFL